MAKKEKRPALPVGKESLLFKIVDKLTGGAATDAAKLGKTTESAHEEQKKRKSKSK